MRVVFANDDDQLHLSTVQEVGFPPSALVWGDS